MANLLEIDHFTLLLEIVYDDKTFQLRSVLPGESFDGIAQGQDALMELVGTGPETLGFALCTWCWLRGLNVLDVYYASGERDLTSQVLLQQGGVEGLENAVAAMVDARLLKLYVRDPRLTAGGAR